MTRPAAVLALLVLSAPAARAGAAPGTGPAGPPAGKEGGAAMDRGTGRSPPQAAPARADGRAALAATLLEEVTGTVREVDRGAHRIVVEAEGERVTLSLDRNTMVYTAAGLGTVLDVKPGAQIRAGRNAEFLAYWVQVRDPVAGPPSMPGAGPDAGAATREGDPAPGAAGPDAHGAR